MTEANILMPQSLFESFLVTGNQEGSSNPKVLAKYFTPDSNWTWYATEFDPASRMFFGLVVGFEMEYGYFSLDELENVRGPLGLRVERDLYFKQTYLSELGLGLA